jgi:hypothetical protein
MGCSGEKEKLEDRILLMKLDRMEIQMQKEIALKKLADKGVAVKQGFIPDYIDPVFAKENNIYDDDEYMLNNRKTDKSDQPERIDLPNRSEVKISKKKSKSSKDVRIKNDIGEKKIKKKKDKDKRKSKNSN